MCLKIKNLLSKTALVSVATTLTLGLNGAQALPEPDEAIGQVLQNQATHKVLSRQDLVNCALVRKHLGGIVSNLGDDVWLVHAEEYALKGGKFSPELNSFTSGMDVSWKEILRVSLAPRSNSFGRLGNAFSPSFEWLKAFKDKERKGEQNRILVSQDLSLSVDLESGSDL